MFKRSLLSASILFTFCHSVNAQQESLTIKEASDEQGQSQFNEVLVTATRNSQNLESVAASVSVITAKEIDENMVENISELFKETPGVTVNTTQRQGVQSINIRGIEGKRIQILVDGASQPGAFDGGPYSFINSSAVSIDPDMLKTVEVVKGAASSLHGSDAIGGVVAFDTKDPKDFLGKNRKQGGQVKLGYSSADKSFNEHVALANRFGEVESLIAFTRRDGDKLQNFAKAPYVKNAVTSQDYSKNDLLVKLQSQLNDQHQISLLGEMISNQSDADLASSYSDNDTSSDNTKQNRFGLKHQWFADSAVADSVTTRANWIDKKEHAETHRFQPASQRHSDNNQKKDYHYSEKRIEIETQLDKEINNHYLNYGLSYKKSKIKNTNQEYNSAPDIDDKLYVYSPNAKESSLGLFVQDEISLLNERLTLTPGVRYDRFVTDPANIDGESFKKFDDAALTGRLGATYQLSPSGTIFGLVSQGFRAPSFDELYYTYDNPIHGYVNEPNPDLKSEKSISYEVGYRHINAFSASEISLYYSDYDDFIAQVSSSGTNNSSPTIYTNENLDEATIKGIEISNKLDLHKIANAPQGLTTRIAAEYTQGEDGQGRPLNSVNPWNAVTEVNYDSPNKTWGTSLKVRYTANKSKSDINYDKDNGGTDKQVATPSATVADLTAYYKPINNITIRAGVMNLTDEKYYLWNDVRGKSALTSDLTQAERNYSLSVKYEF
ncbi:TonB-dependent receptor [Vibrio azureus]|uniref:Putative TonB-dependent receptor n=1 Tax=Vibrio azureus NBRC 104587 TaxID=1219077 RepID=U3CID2_9VIBR|nr:TonB-dependent hemoglobin/transferrin/lactoferrin family receptor [Vibrio azureus]AUI88197.1 TonB-dependent receptor [Vibrio azureus]GAD78008.1 putative TonB-dependent receptor [Vibrio azureus NBRC 104587]